MPYWRSPETLRRAVESVLNQTYRDLVLVLVDDGDDSDFEEVSDITDPRLVRFYLPENRGRYYCDAVVSHACQTPWLTAHDSDDWSEPNRLQEMMRVARLADVVPGVDVVHQMNGRLRVRRPLITAPRHRLQIPHMWHISAVYKTEIFQALIHPGFRVGYDSLLSAMIAASTIRAVPCQRARYHRVGRIGSLTTALETGIGSPARLAEIERLMEIWRRVPTKPTLEELQKIIDAPDVFEDAERLISCLI
jgi:glycosyltransferase involved in cell wall biosynthesis